MNLLTFGSPRALEEATEAKAATLDYVFILMNEADYITKIPLGFEHADEDPSIMDTKCSKYWFVFCTGRWQAGMRKSGMLEHTLVNPDLTVWLTRLSAQVNGREEGIIGHGIDDEYVRLVRTIFYENDSRPDMQ